mgnify:CR=1 FL=1
MIFECLIYVWNLATDMYNLSVHIPCIIFCTVFLTNLISPPYKNTKSCSHWQLKYQLPTLIFRSNPKYHCKKKLNHTSCQTYWGPSIIIDQLLHKIFHTDSNNKKVGRCTFYCRKCFDKTLCMHAHLKTLEIPWVSFERN